MHPGGMQNHRIERNRDNGLDVRTRIFSCRRSSATACAGGLVTIKMLCKRLSGASEGSGTINIAGEAVLFLSHYGTRLLLSVLSGLFNI